MRYPSLLKDGIPLHLQNLAVISFLYGEFSEL